MTSPTHGTRVYGVQDGPRHGAVWVLFLDTDGTVKAHQKISDTEGGFSGVLDDSDAFGYSAAALGDLDGDGCSAACEIEDRIDLYGRAQGGAVGMIVDEISIGVLTTPGQTPAQVAAALAAVINANAALAALGTTPLCQRE